MSKELEAFNVLCGETVEMDLLFIDRNGENQEKWWNSEAYKKVREFEKKYGIGAIYVVEQALKRLEAIDNSNPSESLKSLKELRTIANMYCSFNGTQCEHNKKLANIIEQSLLKAEKEHNSINLLMQELDCKDFAELRKYARCGYKTLNDNAEPSKALECLERIDNTLCLNNIKGKLEFGIDTEENTDCDSVIGMTDDLENIKQVLIQYEQDKKDLELLERVRSGKTLIFVGKGLVMMNADKYHEYLKMEKEPISKKIKKCLKEQAWDIVIKKNVDMLLVKKYDNASDYNSAVWLSGRDKLTDDEFKLLKEGVVK